MLYRFFLSGRKIAQSYYIFFIYASICAKKNLFRFFFSFLHHPLFTNKCIVKANGIVMANGRRDERTNVETKRRMQEVTNGRIAKYDGLYQVIIRLLLGYYQVIQPLSRHSCAAVKRRTDGHFATRYRLVIVS